MAIVASKLEPHSNYLLALDSDFAHLSRYVEFQPENYNCFSIEIARLLFAAASEVDVVCKQICHIIDPSSKAHTIGAYRKEICAEFPKLPTMAVLLPRFGLTLHPWDEWQRKDDVPVWWTAYNKVKHHRDTDLHRGNLKNALNAFAALFLMLLHRYKEKGAGGQLRPSPQLLCLENQRGFAMGPSGTTPLYKVGD
jgi:hypothetical protein